jgi:hypothetical protein
VLGLLLTGNEVRQVSLMGSDESGEPEVAMPERTRVPVIEPVLIGMLPLIACGASLYFAARQWGGVFIQNLSPDSGLAQSLPTSVGGFFGTLRAMITLAEQMLSAIVSTNLLHWRNALFLYLAICLTVRMAPINGNHRGAIGATLLAGLLIALISSLIGTPEKLVANSWPILGFAVGMLMLLMLASLVASGVIGLIRVLAKSR